MSTLTFLLRGRCPPLHFYRWADVRPYISTAGQMSALTFLPGADVRPYMSTAGLMSAYALFALVVKCSGADVRIPCIHTII